jgi:hypothetical protein
MRRPQGSGRGASRRRDAEFRGSGRRCRGAFAGRRPTSWPKCRRKPPVVNAPADGAPSGPAAWRASRRSCCWSCRNSGNRRCPIQAGRRAARFGESSHRLPRTSHPARPGGRGGGQDSSPVGGSGGCRRSLHDPGPEPQQTPLSAARPLRRRQAASPAARSRRDAGNPTAVRRQVCVRFGVIGDFLAGEPGACAAGAAPGNLRARCPFEFVITVGDNLRRRAARVFIAGSKRRVPLLRTESSSQPSLRSLTTQTTFYKPFSMGDGAIARTRRTFCSGARQQLYGQAAHWLDNS